MACDGVDFQRNTIKLRQNHYMSSSLTGDRTTNTFLTGVSSLHYSWISIVHTANIFRSTYVLVHLDLRPFLAIRPAFSQAQLVDQLLSFPGVPTAGCA